MVTPDFHFRIRTSSQLSKAVQSLRVILQNLIKIGHLEEIGASHFKATFVWKQMPHKECSWVVLRNLATSLCARNSLEVTSVNRHFHCLNASKGYCTRVLAWKHRRIKIQDQENAKKNC